jgi:hypothetical protein
MSTQIPFPGNAVNMLPNGVVAGSRKRKRAFTLNDPDNAEVARLATQAAKKKAKLSMVTSLEKEKKKKTNNKPATKPNHQPSIVDVDDPANNQQSVSLRNPRNIIESDCDDDKAESSAATARQNQYPPLVDDINDDDDDDSDDEDEVEVVEQPVESAEAELSQ